MFDYIYRVKEGDTLSALSELFYGNMHYYNSIASYNNIKNPDLIFVNQNIKMPRILKLQDDNSSSLIKLAYRRETSVKDDSETNKVLLKMQVSINGDYLIDKPYQLFDDRNVIHKATTDKDGWIECNIPKNCEIIYLKIQGIEEKYELQIERG